MTFANGVIPQISSGFRTPFRAGAHIVGDKGMIDLPTPWKPSLDGESCIHFTARDGAQEKIVIPPINPYLCEVQAMEACILDGAQPLVPLSLSRDFLRSVLALYQSAQSGEVVRL